MPFVDVPSLDLNVYYTLNPVYDDLSMSFTRAPPPSQTIDQLDDRPLIIFSHAATSSAHSFIYQFRDERMRAATNMLSFDTKYFGWTTLKGERGEEYMTLEVRAVSSALIALSVCSPDLPLSRIAPTKSLPSFEP